MEATLDVPTLLCRAQDLLDSGNGCAQSVLGAFAAHLQEDAFRIAAGFSGGMSFGEVCGAVAGSIMVISLKLAPLMGDTRDTYAKEHTYELCHEFMKAFKIRHGSLCCRDLIGFDLGEFDDELKDLNKRRDLFIDCPGYVRNAVEILFEILY